MAARILYLLAFFIFSTLAFATIPPQIDTYLNKNAQNIRGSLPLSYGAPELIILAQRMAELLIKRYQNIIDPLVKQEELHKELTTYILFDIFPRKQSTDSEDIAHNSYIKKLLEKFSGNIIGNVLRINYKNISIPLSVSAHPNSISFKILGAPVKLDVEPAVSDSKSCFWLRIDPPKNEATLEWLGTLESACPIIVEKQGEFLLFLAEVLAKTMEAKQIKLQDEAQVLCERNQLTTKFHTLRVFQNKSNWYVDHGYKPKDKEIDLLMTLERQFLRNLTLSNINKTLDDRKSQKNISLLFSVFKEQQLNYAHSRKASDNFADFMSWLWETNCEDYIKVYNLIFKTPGIINGELADVIPELKKELGSN